ncbi:MAG: VOC family protein [Propioniciclava sp.]|uniref:VOC family protein n=1 Tax=Propioniciclava sp. TaxID=2038686 RepID=UPI0039E2E01D
MQGIRLSTVTLGTSDPVTLARFYARLLGWTLGPTDDPAWVGVWNPDGGVSIACQLEKNHVRPTWPGAPGDQQMQVHLEIQVDDLQSGLQHARRCGARMAGNQPQANVRVCIDPAGHPFCLWVAG